MSGSLISATLDAVLEENGLTLQQVARLCVVDHAWISQHVEDGLLSPSQQGTEWRFSSSSLLRMRRIATIEHQFDATPELAALVADLQEEIDELRRRLLRAGLE